MTHTGNYGQRRLSPLRESAGGEHTHFTSDFARPVRLLIVERLPGGSSTLRHALQCGYGGFIISTARGIRGALDYVLRRSFDLVLLDIGGSQGPVIQAVSVLWQDLPRTPIVVCAPHHHEALRRRVLRCGAEDMVVEADLAPRELVRRLVLAIDRQRAHVHLRTLITHIDDAALLLDRDSKVREVNTRAAHLLGLSRTDLLGNRLPHDFDVDEPTEIALDGSDGQRRTVQLRVVDVDWFGERCYLATLQDISDRRRVAELQRHLVHADRLASIGKMAAAVAHEVNNPACFVRTNIELARTELARMRAGRRAATVGGLDQLLEECWDGLERICETVRQLNSFSRAACEEIGPFELADAVDVACTIVAHQIRHRARLLKKIADVPPLMGDKAKIVQVLVNLLANAISAISEGDASEHTIEVEVCRKGDHLVVAVSDTGCGIAEELEQEIFQPFFTTKPRGEGTGLGLALSLEIAREHGGELRFERRSEGGARFELVLPLDNGLKPKKPSVLKHTPKAAPESSTPASRARILIIDDERLIRRSLKRVLRQYDVLEAASGRGALDLLASDDAFDAVICDLTMPELGGAEVYREVEETHPQLAKRFLFISGGAFTDSAVRFLERIDRPVLEKPLDLNELLEAIEKLE